MISYFVCSSFLGHFRQEDNIYICMCVCVCVCVYTHKYIYIYQEWHKQNTHEPVQQLLDIFIKIIYVASFVSHVKRRTNLMHNLPLVYFVNLYMFRAYLGPSSGGTTVCIQKLVLIILFRWLLSWLDWNPKSNQDNRQSSKKNNKNQLLYTYGCTCWWWA